MRIPAVIGQFCTTTAEQTVPHGEAARAIATRTLIAYLAHFHPDKSPAEMLAAAFQSSAASTESDELPEPVGLDSALAAVDTVIPHAPRFSAPELEASLAHLASAICRPSDALLEAMAKPWRFQQGITPAFIEIPALLGTGLDIVRSALLPSVENVSNAEEVCRKVLLLEDDLAWYVVLSAWLTAVCRTAPERYFPIGAAWFRDMATLATRITPVPAARYNTLPPKPPGGRIRLDRREAAVIALIQELASVFSEQIRHLATQRFGASALEHLQAETNKAQTMAQIIADRFTDPVTEPLPASALLMLHPNNRARLIHDRSALESPSRAA